MVEVIWTNHALADLENIATYIAQDSENLLNSRSRNYLNKTDILKAFPNSGRMVPEKISPSIRELIDGNYRIIYEIAEESVINILAVHHSLKLLI